MRILRSRVARVTIVAAVAAVLLSSCELREGDPREYGNAAGSGPSYELVGTIQNNVVWSDAR
jgi:hypothetical protein